MSAPDTTCVPCQRHEHHQCRPEWDCSCDHHPAVASAADSVLGIPPFPPVASAVDGDVGLVFCSFATDPGHTCATSFGRPLQPGQRCFHEARRRLFDDIEGTA